MRQLIETARPIALIVMVMLAFNCCARMPRGSRTVVSSDINEVQSRFHVNINTASAAELEQLPGVGKVIAERIVAYRQQNGHFKRREELMMVSGISEKKYEEIRAMIVVE